MSFTKILCPIDFSPGSNQAVRLAVRLANEVNAELVLFHAWYVPPMPYAGETMPPHLFQELADDAQRMLDGVVRDALAGGAKRVTGKLVSGVPWSEIVDVLDNQAFDLCVMGTHGRTGISRILLGSVAEKVVRHASCSVLAVRPDGKIEPFAHVLCPTDFSETAMHAPDVSVELVRPGGGVTLLHVIELPVSYAGEVPFAGFERALDKRSAEELDTWATRLRSKTSGSVVTQSRIGYPGAQILAALDKDPTIDLVVMGSHGRTGITRVLLGSVAEKIVRHARCSVLVVRKRT